MTYTAADSSNSIYGRRVSVRRKVGEFSALRHARRGGFELNANGGATVIRPAV